ncbi:hypothetical protein [Telmatospirillum siberiense]|uniref:hypothetical protein n=1 Tax=Telmatospirillum siberiense TaxID=382514 RepID=UPI0011AF2331|nr:hypothetical protein [Telmatospirillum siberiense]
MAVTIEEYICVKDRASALGVVVPHNIAVLPENFATATSSNEFWQQSEADTVRKIFRKNNIPVDNIFEIDKTPYIQNNGIEWICPTLFITSGIISENSYMVSLALNVLSNYITDLFRGVPGDKKVKFNIVLEKKKNKLCKRISYEGDIEGLSELSKIIMKTYNEQ